MFIFKDTEDENAIVPVDMGHGDEAVKIDVTVQMEESVNLRMDFALVHPVGKEQYVSKHVMKERMVLDVKQNANARMVLNVTGKEKENINKLPYF